MTRREPRRAKRSNLQVSQDITEKSLALRHAMDSKMEVGDLNAAAATDGCQDAGADCKKGMEQAQQIQDWGMKSDDIDFVCNQGMECFNSDKSKCAAVLKSDLPSNCKQYAKGPGNSSA